MIASVPRQLLSTVDFVRRCLGRFVELEGFDRAMALAGQAFAALLPLLIVIGSVSPQGGDDLSDAITSRFKLDPGASDTLHSAVAQPPDPGISVLGVFLLVISSRNTPRYSLFASTLGGLLALTRWLKLERFLTGWQTSNDD